MTPPRRAALRRAAARPAALAVLLPILLAGTAAASSNELATVFTGELAPPADAVVHASGLVTLVLEPGDGALRPDPNDMVSVHFVGRTPDGAAFQDTYAAGKPAGFELGSVFPAWREAIAMMVTGERRRVWIPAALAPQHAANSGPRGAVVFDVELVGVVAVPDPPADLAKPQGAERTAFGAFTRVVAPGAGEAHPGEDAAVLLQYVGWTSAGEVFDASYRRLRPTLFPLAKVMPAFADCVRRMVVGEQRLCWIPEEAGQGQWKGAPEGDLVFHLELLNIGDGAVFADPPAGAKPADGGKGGAP